MGGHQHFLFLSCCISLLTAVGSRSGDEVLKACRTWACRKQLLAPRIRAGFRPSRDTAFSSFLPLLWLSSFSVVNCPLVLRAAYAAVCGSYRSQSATSFLFPSSLFLAPGPPATRCCECSRHPWGTCLLLLLWRFLFHISLPPLARISIEFHGFLRISMDFHGFPRISRDFHGFPWISMDSHGFPIDFRWAGPGHKFMTEGLGPVINL